MKAKDIPKLIGVLIWLIIEYDKYLFWDYDYVSAPIYLWPFTPNVMAAGGFTNGYGFKQE